MDVDLRATYAYLRYGWDVSRGTIAWKPGAGCRTDLGSRYLLVNIPAYRLDAIEGGKSVLDMKVVTGKEDSPTPVLVDRMTSVVFSPYWNIPTDIVEKEILPKIEKDTQ